MKKNLLFVIPSLSAGGGERSLVNLLTHMDYNEFNVDLVLFNKEGLFLEMLPKEVKLVQISGKYEQFVLPIGSSLKHFVRQGDTPLLVNRVMFTLMNRVYKEAGVREQRSWKHIAASMEPIKKHYDAAIGFLEKSSIYFCVDKVSADKKIGWVHTDYDKLELDPSFDQSYFSKLDRIVTVSEECATVLKTRFSKLRDNIDVIHNIVSPVMVQQLAMKETNDLYEHDDQAIIICSVGRLHELKGFDYAVEACKRLIDRGLNIKWYIIGEGPERDKLAKMIANLGVEKHLFLIGLKANPYPYMKHADIYAQTSRVEGKSIAIDEAKILHKPILITNFSTAKDQIVDGVEGIIVEMNVEAIANGLERLVQEEQLRRRLSQNLSRLELGTESEIEKLYELIGLVSVK